MGLRGDKNRGKVDKEIDIDRHRERKSGKTVKLLQKMKTLKPCAKFIRKANYLSVWLSARIAILASAK